jgi:hypothetical protein
MNRTERLLKRFVMFFSSLFKTAGFIATILSILSFLGVGSALFGFTNSLLPLTMVGATIFILSILIFIVFLTLLEEKTRLHLGSVSTSAHAQATPNAENTSVKPISTDTIQYPPPLADEEAEILLKEIVYEYTPDGQTLWQRKRLKMSSLRNGLSHYTDRYHWTGNGKCIVRSLTSGFIVINTRKEEIWDYFEVKFPHALRKGEEVDFTIEWELHDIEKIAIPFLSTMIERETKYLLLRVILPRDLAPKRAYSYEFANYLDTLPVATEEIYWSAATCALSYEVSQPKRNHKYLIRWYNE